MSEQHVERRLAAILAADVAGYSRLMAANEEATLAALRACRAVIDGLVRERRGRVFSTAGDSVVAEFASPVAAVRCAVDAQRALAVFNADLAEDRRMRFRVGVHLGDVMVEDDNLHGDGVNIAARLQEIAEPGGICVSEEAFRQVQRVVEYVFDDAGIQQLKNIAQPVHVFRVALQRSADSRAASAHRPHRPRGWQIAVGGALAGAAIVALATMVWRPPSSAPPPGAAADVQQSLPFPDRPSIAVLPFDNIGDDPAQEYFADGIAEDIITDLSRIPGLFVIARNSSFTYKGESVNIADVSRDLGVRYVLEGSVRKSGNQVRISAQLIDGITGGHVWAERYDRELTDVFAVQDEVTQEVVAALEVKLAEPNRRRMRRAETANMAAYDLFLRAREKQNGFNKEDNVAARELLAEAIALDPDYARAHAFLAWTHLDDWRLGWTDYDPRSLESAARFAQKAVELNADVAGGHAVLGDIYVWQQQHELAIEKLEHAVMLQPNRADFHAMLGDVLTWSGRAEEGLLEVDVARRLNPNGASDYLWNLGHAYFVLRRYDDAITAFDEAAAISPEFWPALIIKASAHGHLGHAVEARNAAALASDINPKLATDMASVAAPYANAADFDHLMAGLRKAEIVD